MGDRKLAASVHVHHEDGTTVVYQAGESVPAADAKLIKNDKAWAEPEAKSSK